MPRKSSRPARVRGRRTSRRLGIFLPLFIGALVVGMAGSIALAWWGEGLIQRQGVTGLQVAEREEARIVNVLVVGDDSRKGLTAEQRDEIKPGRAEGNRTDSVMLLQLEVNGKGRAAALSFPRDLRVERCDGSVGRINAAYTVGLSEDGDGASCLVETISDLTGIPIHHYVEVNFAGFIEVVDALGGIELYLDKPLADEKANIDLPSGCVTLSGTEALGFVRARHVDNDFGRMARQQRFVKETLRKATSMGVLANPPKLVSLIEAAAGAVRTDEDLTLSQMRDIAQGMRAASADKLKVHTVPSVDQHVGSAWYVVELPRQAAELYRAFRSGEVLDGPPQATEVPVPPISVLNADGTKGLADAGASLLQARGFEIDEVGNADVEGLPRTLVHYPPHLEKAAAKIAGILNGAELVAGQPGDPLVVELGMDMERGDLLRRADATPELSTEASEAPTERADDGLVSQSYTGASDKGVDC